MLKAILHDIIESRNAKIEDRNSDEDEQKEQSLAAEAIWNRMKNKHDVEDVLQDARVDKARIYQPVTNTRRVKMKNHKTLLTSKYEKLCIVVNTKSL